MINFFLVKYSCIWFLFSYIDVDIYGTTSCSTLRCSPEENGNCLEMVNSTYKVTIMMSIVILNENVFQFYLSLENSLCLDYITEKFWKILPYNVIPIVLNAVNMTTIAPPHSYIDIKDFSSFEGCHS